MLYPYPECYAESLIALNVLGVLWISMPGVLSLLSLAVNRVRRLQPILRVQGWSGVWKLIVNILVRDWTCH
jgi:hypothetical protein